MIRNSKESFFHSAPYPSSSKPHARAMSNNYKSSDTRRLAGSQSGIYCSTLHDISDLASRLHPARISPPQFLDKKATQLSGRARNPPEFRQPPQCPRGTGWTAAHSDRFFGTTTVLLLLDQGTTLNAYCKRRMRAPQGQCAQNTNARCSQIRDAIHRFRY